MFHTATIIFAAIVIVMVVNEIVSYFREVGK